MFKKTHVFKDLFSSNRIFLKSTTFFKAQIDYTYLSKNLITVNTVITAMSFLWPNFLRKNDLTKGILHLRFI